MSPEPVAPVTARRLLARLASLQREGRVPSVVAGVVRDGGLVWAAGHGDVPGDPSDVQYRIGSITKTFTAVLIHQLVVEGRLTLETPVGEVLGNVGYGDRTVRQLLAHSGGLTAEPAGPWWERAGAGDFAALAAANDGSLQTFSPGSRFHYTNLGYGLLGEVVARLRGTSWWDCVEARILAPLGMTRTTYHPTAPHAQGFSVHPYTGQLLPEPHSDTGAMASAGQMWSTVADLAAYAGFLLDGHPDVLAADRLAEACTPQVGGPGVLDAAYGLGLSLQRGGSGTLIGHNGSMPGFVAGCYVDPKRRTGAVMLCNGTAFAKADRPLVVTLLEELEAAEPTVPEPWRPSSPVPAEVADVLGRWHWGARPMVASWEGTELVFREGAVEQYRYRVHDGRVVGVAGYQAGEELRVVRRPDGAVSHLDLATFVLTREPYDPDAPIPGGLATE